MTTGLFHFQQREPLTGLQKGGRCLNKPERPIWLLLCAAIGSSILNSTMTRSKHELSPRELPFPHEPAATGSSCTERLRPPMETAFSVFFLSTTSAEGTEKFLLRR